MPLTPIDIRKKSFSTQLRGLSIREVRSFMELVAKEMEELRKERGMLADKVDELTARLETYERTEELLKDTLLTAQRSSSELRNTAEEQAKTIITKAEQEAREIVHRAEREADRLRVKLREIETRRASLLDQIRGIAQSYLAMADRWESGKDTPEDEAQGSGER